MGGLNKYGPSRQTTFFLSYFPDPADTRCNNSAIMTSKRRRDVVLTSQWRYCCVMCPLGMTQVFQIWFHLNLFLDIHLTNSYMSLRKGLGNGLVPKCYTHPIINALPKPVVMIIVFCLLGLPYQRHFDVKRTSPANVIYLWDHRWYFLSNTSYTPLAYIFTSRPWRLYPAGIRLTGCRLILNFLVFNINLFQVICRMVQHHIQLELWMGGILVPCHPICASWKRQVFSMRRWTPHWLVISYLGLLFQHQSERLPRVSQAPAKVRNQGKISGLVADVFIGIGLS